MDQPPTPPGGGTQPPDWGEMRQKLQAAQGPNRVILIAGLVFFVDSFLPWYGIGLFNVSGWNAGGLAVIAILLAIGATVLAAAEVVGAMKNVKIPRELNLCIAAGGGAFALLQLISESRITKFGIYIAITAGLAMAYAGYQKFQATKG